VYAKEEHPMKEGYFFSDEPGYYEAGLGGVRLETVLMSVKKVNLPYSSKDYGNFLGFEPVCLVPFEPNLINYELLSDAQLNWLNRYNKMIRDKVGPALKNQGKDRLAR
jgi:Xaa-Pro aminopeptidase